MRRLVPADYERKQTLVNAERFTTPELKEYETKILTAQERSLRDRAADLCASCGGELLDGGGADAGDSAAGGGDRPAGVLCASGGAARVGEAAGGGVGRAGVCGRRGTRWWSGGMEESGGGRFVPNSMSHRRSCG